MTEIEFSDWYFLFFSLSNNRTEAENPRGFQVLGHSEKLETPSSSVSDEVTRSLSEKLKVPVSEFRVSSVEQYRVGWSQSQLISVVMNLECSSCNTFKPKQNFQI